MRFQLDPEKEFCSAREDRSRAGDESARVSMLDGRRVGAEGLLRKPEELTFGMNLFRFGSVVTLFLALVVASPADEGEFGRAGELAFVELFNGKDLSNWIDVNTSPDTWSVKDGLLVCTGKPIGVMRSTKMYENFILVVEWRHMEAGGNSGVFLWSDAKPEGNRLPRGMEVQMLELEWPYIHACLLYTSPSPRD